MTDMAALQRHWNFMTIVSCCGSFAATEPLQIVEIDVEPTA